MTAPDRQISRTKLKVISDEERIKRLKNTIQEIRDDPNSNKNSNYLRRLKKQLRELQNK